MSNPILPRIPSDLIELALADLIKCERSKKYIIDMSRWYVPDDYYGLCAVCLAGAVIAQHLGDGPERRRPEDFRGNTGALNALDCFRIGDIKSGFGSLRLPLSKTDQFDRDIIHYAGDPGKFKRQMRRLARDLRAAGF